MLVVVLTTTSLAELDSAVADEPPSVSLLARTFAVAPPAPDYWTPARMEAAKPAPVAARTGNGEAAPPVTRPGAKRRLMEPPARATARRWVQGGAVTQTVGRVFFSFGFSDASCSASVVRSANRATVVTAAHCLSPNGRAVARNWIFVPGYNAGATPYGKWSAERLIVAPGWADVPGGNLNEDVGFAVMRPRGGKYLEDVVGSNAIGFSTPIGGEVHSFGYPAQSPFDGELLYFCQGLTRPDTFGLRVPNPVIPEIEPGSTDLSLDCDMNGGSSGGPWLANLDANKRGTVISVNSFEYDLQPGVTLGPRFDASIKAIYDVAQALPQVPSPLPSFR